MIDEKHRRIEIDEETWKQVRGKRKTYKIKEVGKGTRRKDKSHDKRCDATHKDHKTT